MQPLIRTLSATILAVALCCVSVAGAGWDRSAFKNGEWTCCRICPSLFYHVKPVTWASLLETGQTPRTPSSFIQVAARLHSRQVQEGRMTKLGRCCNVCKQEYTNTARYPAMLHYTQGIPETPFQEGDDAFERYKDDLMDFVEVDASVNASATAEETRGRSLQPKKPPPKKKPPPQPLPQKDDGEPPLQRFMVGEPPCCQMCPSGCTPSPTVQKEMEQRKKLLAELQKLAKQKPKPPLPKQTKQAKFLELDSQLTPPLAPTFVETMPQRFGLQGVTNDDDAAAESSGSSSAGDESSALSGNNGSEGSDNEASADSNEGSDTENSEESSEESSSKSDDRSASALARAMARLRLAVENSQLHHKHRFRRRGFGDFVKKAAGAVGNFFNKAKTAVTTAVTNVAAKVATVAKAAGAGIANAVQAVAKGAGGAISAIAKGDFAGAANAVKAVGADLKASVAQATQQLQALGIPKDLAGSLPPEIQKAMAAAAAAAALSPDIAAFVKRPIPVPVKIPFPTSLRKFIDKANPSKENDPPGTEDVKPSRCAIMETCCLMCYSTWPGDTIDPTTMEIRKKLQSMAEEPLKRRHQKAQASNRDSNLQQPQLLHQGKAPKNKKK